MGLNIGSGRKGRMSGNVKALLNNYATKKYVDERVGAGGGGAGGCGKAVLTEASRASGEWRSRERFKEASSVVFINGVRYWGGGDDYDEIVVSEGVAQGIAMGGLSKDDEVYVLADITE